jgi:G3E family GTPase
MRAEYVMVGGFLGAGKTTALLRLAEHFVAKGRRVGLITNDQSYGLVDTAMAAAQGYPVEEITGGCFCCRFTSLTDAADRLRRDCTPDVFLAEPVGSCTDLRATVQYPLCHMYGDDYRVAPLSVLVDPIRAARMLGLDDGRTFAPKVQYIYEKQLEEADIIVVNKSDLITPERIAALEAGLKIRFPRAAVLTVSARSGAGLEEWFNRLSESPGDWKAMDVDSDAYADGEALLGWLNAACRVSSAQPFDGNQLLRLIAAGIQKRLATAAIEIAHFKMTLAPEHGNDLAVLNVVRSDAPADSTCRLAAELTAGELLVNLRAEADPVRLKAISMAAIEEASGRLGVALDVGHIEHFRPGRPEPTHRLEVP